MLARTDFRSDFSIGLSSPLFTRNTVELTVERTTAGVTSSSADVGIRARTEVGNTGGDLIQFALS